MLVAIELCVILCNFLAVRVTFSELQSAFRANLAAQDYIFAATSTTGYLQNKLFRNIE